MTAILSALLPIFLLIPLGYGLRRAELFAPAFWSGAERLAFYALLPSLIVVNLAGADLAGKRVAPMAAALIAGTLLTGGAAWMLSRRIGHDGPTFTSLFQGAIRPNVYVGIAAAATLYGPVGLALIAVDTIAVIPLVNIMSALALARHGRTADGGAADWRASLLAVARNPIIIGCVIGALLNVTGIGLPPVLGPFLQIIGRAALPVSLLAVGAALDFRAVRHAGAAVAWATVLKLALLPGLVWLSCLAAGVDGVAASVAVLYGGQPCAASAYVMARQMGGDAVAMAGIITVTTLAAMATLPLILFAVG